MRSSVDRTLGSEQWAPPRSRTSARHTYLQARCSKGPTRGPLASGLGPNDYHSVLGQIETTHGHSVPIGRCSVILPPHAEGGAIRFRHTSRTRNPTGAIFGKSLAAEFITDICANYEWTPRKHVALKPATSTLRRVSRRPHVHGSSRTSDVSRSTTTTTRNPVRN